MRVGAHVFSSSKRHAGDAINYWCLPCMCTKPSVRRQARLNPTELERCASTPYVRSRDPRPTPSDCVSLACGLVGLHRSILPGVTLLDEAHVQRACQLLDVPLPSAAQQAAQATGRRRATRSGRAFGNWAR